MHNLSELLTSTTTSVTNSRPVNVTSSTRRNRSENQPLLYSQSVPMTTYSSNLSENLNLNLDGKDEDGKDKKSSKD